MTDVAILIASALLGQLGQDAAMKAWGGIAAGFAGVVAVTFGIDLVVARLTRRHP